MLIIKAYINNKLIDEIHVRRIDGDPNGLCTYVIDDPPDFDDKIRHNRTRGWKDLGGRALRHMSSVELTRQNSLQYEEIKQKAAEKQKLKANLIKAEVEKLGVQTLTEIRHEFPFKNSAWCKTHQKIMVGEAKKAKPKETTPKKKKLVFEFNPIDNA